MDGYGGGGMAMVHASVFESPRSVILYVVGIGATAGCSGGIPPLASLSVGLYRYQIACARVNIPAYCLSKARH